MKELLANATDDKIVELAEELDIQHGYSPSRDIDTIDTRFGLPNHFRLFLSHVSKIKAKVSHLQNVLRQFGIAGFVAHEDIEPTRDWQHEIEKALWSMDALVAILSPGF